MTAGVAERAAAREHGARRAWPPASVLVADDSDLVYWGMRALLAGQPWCERCLHARTVAQARELCAKYAPRVAIVGAGLDTATAEPVGHQLKQVEPRIATLLISSVPLSSQRVRAAGAAGAVKLDEPASAIIGLVRSAAMGRPVPAAPSGIDPRLSARQTEVLQLLADGATNGEIARALFLSPHTVKQHTSTLYRKLRVRNRTEAVQRALQNGLLRSR